MASVSDIVEVRKNTNESSDETYLDELIGAYIDAYGVAGATAQIWREKAAEFASLVDVTESGATHKYSDLYKSALAMSAKWEGLVPIEPDPPSPDSGRVKVKKIVRS